MQRFHVDEAEAAKWLKLVAANDGDRGAVGDYLHAILASLVPDSMVAAPWQTTRCPECGVDLAAEPGPFVTFGDLDGHMMFGSLVVIGCEGYWVLPPHHLGLSRGLWDDWVQHL